LALCLVRPLYFRRQSRCFFAIRVVLREVGRLEKIICRAGPECPRQLLSATLCWDRLRGNGSLLGLERLLAVASAHWPTMHRSLEASFGNGPLMALLPAASIVGGTIAPWACLFTGLVNSDCRFRFPQTIGSSWFARVAFALWRTCSRRWKLGQSPPIWQSSFWPG